MQHVGQIVAAVRVVGTRAQLLIPIPIASRNQRVVHAQTGIGHHAQNRATPVRHQGIADAGRDFEHGCAAMFHRHVFAHIGAVESPGIDHLRTVGIDHHQDLTLAQEHAPALPRGDGGGHALGGQCSRWLECIHSFLKTSLAAAVQWCADDRKPRHCPAPGIPWAPSGCALCCGHWSSYCRRH
jgi:hypothetical protein